MNTSLPPSPRRVPVAAVGLLLLYFFPLLAAVALASAAGLTFWVQGRYPEAVAQLAQLTCSPGLIAFYGLPLTALFVWRAWRRAGPALGPAAPTGEPLLWFQALDAPWQKFALTLKDLARPIFVSGRPGAGKTTLAIALACALMRRPTPRGRRQHTVTIDLNREFAGPLAAESRRLGRETLVIELGNPSVCLPLVVARPGEDGVDAFVESIRKSWFSHEAELPVQMRDVLKNTFSLLGRGGYGPDQALRALLSPSFQDGLLRAGPGELAPHAGEWIKILRGLSDTERYRKLASSLARLFHLLQSRPLRRALSGRNHGGLTLERLIDPNYAGPGIDLILTMHPSTNAVQSYFFAGLVFNELLAVLRLRLSRPDGPEIAVFVDEAHKYAAPEAQLDILSTARNAYVGLVMIAHSIVLLDEVLQRQLVASAAGRILGSETGPGAEAAATQLYRYQPDLVATLGPDDRPSRYWSASDQLAMFLDRLRNLPDYNFLVRLPGLAEPVWCRPLYVGPGRPRLASLAAAVADGLEHCGVGARPWLRRALSQLRSLAAAEAPARSLVPPLSAAEAEQALAEAALACGRPVSELDAELDRENDELDKRFGSIAHRPGNPDVDASDRSWEARPDTDFAPW